MCLFKLYEKQHQNIHIFKIAVLHRSKSHVESTGILIDLALPLDDKLWPTGKWPTQNLTVRERARETQSKVKVKIEGESTSTSFQLNNPTIIKMLKKSKYFCDHGKRSL